MLRNPWLKTPVDASHLNAATNLVNNLQSALPDLPNLTKEDKQSCIKVGDSQSMFMENIKDICVQRPNIMPAWHDLADYQSRVASLENLMGIQTQIMALIDEIDNALIGAKHDVMVYSLDYYHSLKRAKQSGMPGLNKLYERVRDHFKHSTGHAPEDQYPEINSGSTTEDPGAVTDENKEV